MSAARFIKMFTLSYVIMVCEILTPLANKNVHSYILSGDIRGFGVAQLINMFTPCGICATH